MALLTLAQSIWSGRLQELCRQAASGQYSTEGCLSVAHCVLGFAFGVVQDNGRQLPGQSNEQLAQHAHAHCPDLPLILQKEVADAYRRLSPGRVLYQIDQHRRAGAYLDTREVAEQAWELMRKQGWQRVVVLAQGHHLPRARAVCRRLGMDTVVLPGLEQVPFCPQSAQPWTRDLRRWWRREVQACLYYAWKGWI